MQIHYHLLSDETEGNLQIFHILDVLSYGMIQSILNGTHY